MTQLDRRQRRFAILCVAPALVLFTLWVAWPTVRALGYALTRWNGFGDATYVGVRQFRELATESGLLLLALKNNLILMTVPTVLALSISLGFAAAIHRGVRGAKFFQVLFFFPNILSAVAVSVLWLLMYSTTEYGVFNACLRFAERVATVAHFLLGTDQGLTAHLELFRALGAWEPYAFADSRVLIWWLVPMLVWGSVGFFMLLFLAAMQNIPESLYEAARIDGASPLRAFAHITVPLVWDTIVVALVFFGIGGLKVFDQVWVFEQQQSRPDSNTIATLMYGRIFEEYRIGQGTAIAVVQFVLVLIVTVVLLRMWRREALEY